MPFAQKVAPSWVAEIMPILLLDRTARAALVTLSVRAGSTPYTSNPAKVAGATGLLVGLFVPVIGVMAEIGLMLYFAGAVVTVVRAHTLSTGVPGTGGRFHGAEVRGLSTVSQGSRRRGPSCASRRPRAERTSLVRPTHITSR